MNNDIQRRILSTNTSLLQTHTDRHRRTHTHTTHSHTRLSVFKLWLGKGQNLCKIETVLFSFSLQIINRPSRADKYKLEQNVQRSALIPTQTAESVSVLSRGEDPESWRDPRPTATQRPVLYFLRASEQSSGAKGIRP